MSEPIDINSARSKRESRKDIADFVDRAVTHTIRDSATDEVLFTFDARPEDRFEALTLILSLEFNLSVQAEEEEE